MATRKKTILNSRQQKFLKGLGHHLSVKAMIGKEGLTEPVIKSINKVVDANELVKVRIQENFPHERKEGAAMLAAKSGTALVQIIGRTALIYRGNPDLQADRRITLPN